MNDLLRTSKRYYVIILLIILLPFLVVGVQQIQKYLSRAGGVPANIHVNTTHTLERINPIWNSFSQGGEEPTDMIKPLSQELKTLSPRYIRIDHLFDHHPTVKRSDNGALIYDFSELDGIVRSILSTGALPFFSLSYMPQALAEHGQPTDKPKNWREWQEVIQKTIEHYSGKSNFNLKDVYYEVWNEPDLFGNWKYYGDKNYLTLYTYAARGAMQAANTNSFKLGGPATTQLYENWIRALAKHVSQNQLRFDFFSWHRYHDDPKQYTRDVTDVTEWLFYDPALVTMPRIISEWGFDSDMNPGYDGALAAAHAVTTARNSLYGYEQLLAFEVVDGVDPNGKAYWGRWGLFTHPTHGKIAKPRYYAFQLLREMQGSRLLVEGEGSWVSGFAVRDEGHIKVILANYDPDNRHTEQVPVVFTNLLNGIYEYRWTRLGENPVVTNISVMDNSFATEVIMPQNSVYLLELTEQVITSTTTQEIDD